MARIIAIANQKGGVGKTTTAINLASCLAQFNKKTLIIDSDPQGNSTQGLGIDKTSLEETIYDLLIGHETIDNVIIEGVYENLDMIASGIDLAGVEIELNTLEDCNFILKKAIESKRDDYDFIIIDCPPSLTILTINALVASDTVLVPVQCEFFALEGLSQLMNTVNLVQNRLNPNLEIEGIVFTMFDARTNLSLEVVEEVKNVLKRTNIYKTIIPKNVRLAEAPSYGMPINHYDIKSKGASAYLDLAEEVIKR